MNDIRRKEVGPWIKIGCIFYVIAALAFWGVNVFRYMCGGAGCSGAGIMMLLSGLFIGFPASIIAAIFAFIHLARVDLSQMRLWEKVMIVVMFATVAYIAYQISPCFGEHGC